MAAPPSGANVQKLHLVGFTTDHKGLILTARRGSRSGGFVLELGDDAGAVLQALASRAAEAAEAPESPAAARPASALSVRELQARLRAGRSIEAVADEAGVDADWVARFAPPVLAEQAQVISSARGATYIRPRLGPSALPLGASVYRNLSAKGIAAPVEELDRGWDARQLVDGRWLVTFTYTSRGRRQHAGWEVDARVGEVMAHDRLGGQLAFVAGAPPPYATTAAGRARAPWPASTGEPSETERANSRRVAQARKLAEAQLAEAARQAARRSVTAVRQAAQKPQLPSGPPRFGGDVAVPATRNGDRPAAAATRAPATPAPATPASPDPTTGRRRAAPRRAR